MLKVIYKNKKTPENADNDNIKANIVLSQPFTFHATVREGEGKGECRR